MYLAHVLVVCYCDIVSPLPGAAEEAIEEHQLRSRREVARPQRGGAAMIHEVPSAAVVGIMYSLHRCVDGSAGVSETQHKSCGERDEYALRRYRSR